MIIKQHDTRPDLEIDVSDGGGEVDLDSATIRIIARRWTGGEVFTDADPIVGESTVTHKWAAGETSEPGRIWIEVEVEWPDNSRQTFPAYGQLAVDVVEDLG